MKREEIPVKIVKPATKVLKDLSMIILGTNKDGSPRSVVDAKIALEKAKKKRRR